MGSSDSMSVDLHTHTTVSDGEYSPADLVAAAVDVGLSVIAVTDHDAVAAIPLARAAAPSGLEVLVGTELTCQVGGREAHILAYGFDLEEPNLSNALARFAADREERAAGIVERLRDLGLSIEMSDVEAESETGTIARPHVAMALVRRGHAASVDEAFQRYLGRRRPAFVAKPALDPAIAFDLVRAAGGVSVLAHPGTFRRDDLIPILVEAGLDGIEARHTEHSAANTRHYEQMAASLGLLVTGGSDFHGTPGHHGRLGRPAVPYAWYEALIARVQQRR